MSTLNAMRRMFAIIDPIACAAGRYPGVSTNNKFGRNVDVDAAAAEDIWDGGGTYAGFLAAASAIEIVSASADDAAAGTGARTVVIHGLDASYAAQSETVALNGATPVALTKTYLRINRAYVATAGTGLTNAGIITIRVPGPGATLAQISATFGQTLMAIYTVPAGYTALMTQVYFSVEKAISVSADMYLWERGYGGAKRIKHVLGGKDITVRHVWSPPRVVDAKTDIWLQAAVSANDADISAGFDLILLPND